MQHARTEDVQPEPDAAHDEHSDRVLNALDRYEPLDGLQENADAQGQEEDPVEESAQQLGPLPSKGEVLGRFAPL